MGFCDCNKLRHLYISDVIGGLVTVGTRWRTDGAEPDGLNTLAHAVIVKLRLLEAGMELHFNQCGLDAAERQDSFKLRYCHA